MLKFLRGWLARVLSPLARALSRWGVTPDAVTWIGTIGTVAACLGLIARGELAIGAIVAGVFALFDALDGVLARTTGRQSTWGAYLDSTLDRVADAAVFIGIAWWFTGDGGSRYLAALALACLATGALVSYAKARAEGLGATVDVGIAERADRLVIALVGVGLYGFGLPLQVLTFALSYLAVASVVTVVQRMVVTRKQLA